MTDEAACLLDLSVLKVPHHGSSVPQRYMTPEVLHKDIVEFERLRSDLAHETAHIQLSYYQFKQPPNLLYFGHYPLQPATATFVPLSLALHDAGGAAATMCTEAWSWATPSGAASPTVLGAVEARDTALGAGPIPSYSLADLPPQASLSGDPSAAGAIETLASPSTQQVLRPQWPGQFGAVVPVAVKTEQSVEHGLLYRVSNEPVFGVILVLRAGVPSIYRDGLVCMVDGIRTALCLVLILVLAALTRRPKLVSFLLVLLAVCLRYGHRSEPDDHLLPAHQTSPITGRL